ncbi:MAG: hypothetical protein RID11_10135 [Roseovarius sp.]|jgi:hypothetical protein|uniref:hypothetical protein n=1 Tax=Roseovarius sp. TaxID=1486281 RepID=UPI0032EF090D
MLRIFLSVVISILVSAVQATAWCTQPVQDGSPKGVEVEQFWRMAKEVLTIPSYPQLIIKPANRQRLHTIKADRFEPLVADYPSAWLWSYRDHYRRNDGTVWGVGGGNTVHILKSGESDFTTTDISGFLTHEYDPKREKLLLLYEDRGLLEWDGERLLPSSLAGEPLGLNDRLPRYIPHLDIYIAGRDRTLYIISGSPPYRWNKLDLGWNRASRDVWDVQASDFRATKDTQLVVFSHNKNRYVYDRSRKTKLELLYEIPSQGLLIVPSYGRMLLFRGPERWSYLTRDGLVRVDPASQAVPLPESGIPLELGPASARAKGKLPPLVRSGTGIYYFDGRTFYEVPHETRSALMDMSADWYLLGNRVFAVTEQGFYRLEADLTTTRLIVFDDLPRYMIDDPVESAIFGGTFLHGRDRGLWHIVGENVTKIPVVGSMRTNRYLSDIPGTQTGLLLNETGLHLLARDCKDIE